MFDFVPIDLYTPLYHYIILMVIFLTVLQSYTQSLTSIKTISFNRNLGFIVVVFVILYMGLRPLHRVFTDMVTYANQFERLQGAIVIPDTFNDPLFGLFIFFSAQLVTVETFFFLCALLYILPLYFACEKWFKHHWFYAFLVLISTFVFWAYGVNGIRNGIATSFFVLAISRKSLSGKILFFIVSIGFHKSMLLPLAGYLLANNLNIKVKYFFYLWIMAIPISIFSGGFWEQFFASTGFGDDRLSYLTTENELGKFSGSGFRWDFLIFSTLPVLFGGYYVFKKKILNKEYLIILSIYLFANAFWILVIRANFSNRFAYLSWFLMGLVIIYPLLKKYFIKNQHKKIGLILIIFYSFTFLMNVLLK